MRKKKNELQNKHELDKKKEDNRHMEALKQTDYQNEQNKRQHVHQMSQQGHYIPVKILKKGCIDNKGNEYNIGTEIRVLPEVANNWILKKSAKYQARMGD